MQGMEYAWACKHKGIMDDHLVDLMEYKCKEGPPY